MHPSSGMPHYSQVCPTIPRHAPPFLGMPHHPQLCPIILKLLFPLLDMPYHNYSKTCSTTNNYSNSYLKYQLLCSAYVWRLCTNNNHVLWQYESVFQGECAMSGPHVGGWHQGLHGLRHQHLAGGSLSVRGQLGLVRVLFFQAILTLLKVISWGSFVGMLRWRKCKLSNWYTFLYEMCVIRVKTDDFGIQWTITMTCRFPRHNLHVQHSMHYRVVCSWICVSPAAFIF